MELLNKLYNKSCEPNYKNYNQISNNIILVNNFFKDFDLARDFFIKREKWKCIQYQGHSQPGYITLFPNWIGKSLMEKYIFDNKLIVDKNSYEVQCTFRFLHNEQQVFSISNSDYFPHIDDVETQGELMYICLINLNNTPVSTNFYSYKNKEYCDSKILSEWSDYEKNLNEKIQNFYNKKIFTLNEAKCFLENQKLNTNLIKEVNYSPNQAMIYPANLFHSAKVPEEFDENNYRSVLRIIFCVKNLKQKNIKYK